MKNKKKILLVEDEALIAMGQAKTLEEYGYEVQTAGSGTKAVECIENDPAIDLVLMDIDLGNGIDGTEAARRILSFRNLPIVFLTSHSEKGMVEKVRGITRYGYVIKNSGLFVLLSSIEMAFELFEAHEQTKAKERELEKVAETLNQAQKIAGFGSWDYNIVTDRPLWSDQMFEIFGFDKEDGEPSWEEHKKTIHPDDRDKLDKAVKAAITEGSSYSILFRIVHPERGIVWGHTMGKAVLDEAGDVVSLTGVVQDITERKKIEDKFKESELRYRTLTDSGLALIWTSDETKQCDFFNLAWLEFTGRSLEQELGDGWIDNVHPDDLDYCLQIYSSAFDNREPFTMEYRLKHNSGEYRWIIDEGNPRYDNNGTFLGFIGHCLDITMQKNVEEELQRKKQRNDLLLSVTKIILEVEDFQKAARHVFDACCELTGAVSGYVALLSDDGSENEVLFLEAGGMECTVDPSLPMPIRGLREKAYQSGRAVYDNDFAASEWMQFMPEGHVHLFNVLFAPLNIGGKTVGIMGIANKPDPFTDDDALLAEAFGDLAAISLRNSRVLENLVTSEKKIHSLLEEKEILLKETHHRIKNNMNTLMSLLALQADMVEESGAVEVLQEAGSRLQSMMVLYDKLYQSANYREISAREYISSLADQIAGIFIKGKQVHIEKDIDDFILNVHILFPLGIIINELITNAIKYAFPGDKGTITVAAKTLNDKTIISISDNGIGLPENIKETSSGFGLMLVEKLAEQIDGTLKINRHNGTEFIIIF